MVKCKCTCDCGIINEEKVNELKKANHDDSILNNLCNFYKVIGDETRIKIIWVLRREEMCVGDIANILNMTKSSISHQLAILRENDVVKFKKIGKVVYYSLNDEHVEMLFKIAIEHVTHKLKEK